MSDVGFSLEHRKKLKARIQADPVFHIEKIQGVTTLEPYQAMMARAIAENDRVAIAACHDVGKTWTLSKIVLWLGSSFAGVKIITTAPTAVLVEKLLWSEIRDGYRLSKVPLGGRMLNIEWKIREDWFAIGLSPKEDAGGGEGQGKASNFQGFHGVLVVIIFDEATGVPPKRWLQAEGMMTSAHVKFVAIGNPTSSTSEFAACFKSPAWHKIYLSCFDSPNLIANGITDLEKLIAELDLLRGLSAEAQRERMKAYKVVQPRLLTLKWVMEKALTWGIDHPLFQSKVLGKFPEEDDHVLMPLSAVVNSQSREFEPTPHHRYSIGVDVARFGSDKSVLTSQWGPKVFEPKPLIKKDNMEVAGEVVAAIRVGLELGVPGRNICVVIDGTGVGSGVIDRLKELQREKTIPPQVEIREVNFGDGFEHIQDEELKAEDKKLYFNRKAKLFVQLSQDLKKNLCLPQYDTYLEELPTIIFRFDSRGKYVIESKDEYKRRTGRSSPDYADSLALSNEGQYGDASNGRFESQPNSWGTIAGSVTGGQW